ncbi:MAG TPA: citramalate synthase [Candidatus Hydrogenedentes bacterium]|nr:citramalate synthase [Candidatus Hydrogenedentota bacterium]
MKTKIEIYDTTLRDGAQGPGVKFSAEDQVQVVLALDTLGISYIEGGQPGSNPKAADLFQRLKDVELKNSVIAAFGSTRHRKRACEDDPNMKSLVEAGTSVVTIFAKSAASHVRDVLGITLDENLTLIRESIEYLKSKGKRVFLDVEHFFDGYYEDAAYPLAVLTCAAEAGAEALVLCETNGGRLPHEVEEITAIAKRHAPDKVIGIHTHNDTGCAVANVLSAVRAGATHVQGTMNGYGERCGNVDLCSVIPNLQFKMGFDILTHEQLARLTRKSHLIAELANMTSRDYAPYVGRDAFTHKGGMHADAVRKRKTTYEHIDPGLVGNTTHVAVSEMAGRSSLIQKAAELGIVLSKDGADTSAILDRVKELEAEGYEFEGADASLELIMRRATNQHRCFFDTLGFHARVSQPRVEMPTLSEATVKVVLPGGSIEHTVAEGHGPVDALNNALRKALWNTYPEIEGMHLEDYKVRILDGKLATKAKTRVLIETSDREETWNTIGVSENLITASYVALLDSFEYFLLRRRGGQ